MKLKNIIAASLLPLNILLLFFLIVESKLVVPAYVQVFGRMHPVMLHFPIVFMLIYGVFVLLVPSKFKDELWYPVIGELILLIAAITAVLTALMGLILSKELGYDLDALAWHKYTGVCISFVLFILYSFRNWLQNHLMITKVIIAINAIIIIWAGHMGANITHGENFMLGPLEKEQIRKVPAFEEAEVYADVVQPIFEVKCINCHNSNKAKGSLIMETTDMLLKGGKTGVLWDSTESDFGLLMRRIHLPETNKKHMPPAGKPQLTNEEVEIIYRWIKSGANFKTKLADLPPDDSLRLIAAAKFQTNTIEEYSFKAADEGKVKKLNNDYRSVIPLSLGSPALAVEFFNAGQFKTEQLKDLLEVKNQVVSMTLNKMPVTDGDLKIIGEFINLRKLSLSFTNITGASLTELSRLKQLKQLSLSGTKVQTAHLKSLSSLPKLTELYIWNTGVQSPEIASIQKQFKNVSIEGGFKGDTIIMKLSPPLIQNEEVVITKPLPLKMKHYVNGVTIRYTTDGTEPDSIKSLLYKSDAALNNSATIKAKAFKKGWISSDVTEQTFFKSAYKPDSVRLLTSPDPIFKADGAITIIDAQKGELAYKAGKWLGYKIQPMEALLYFDKPSSISSITVSGLVDIGAYIMPPQTIEIWGGESAGNMRLLKRITPQQPSKEQPVHMQRYEVAFKPVKEKLYKLVVTPINKLPVWHRGKGDKAWTFVDEIFVN